MGEIPRTGVYRRFRLLGRGFVSPLDTDAANEVDDQYAIALGILSPERFDIEGFVPSHSSDRDGPGGVDASAKEIESVLEKGGALG